METIDEVSDTVYAISVREGPKTLVGSYKKSSNENYIQLLETGQRYMHRLPPSKVAWMRTSDTSTFGSTSTSLRVWRANEEKPILKLYATNKTACNSSASPMTSFDWNPQMLHKAATCSIDTTVAVWDVERGKLETQLIAHDKAVFDVSYLNSHQFCSVSQDGSLRQFDSRDLDHSTILYEDSVPLLRLAACSNSFLIAVAVHENPDLLLFDVRKPGFLSAVLRCGYCPNALVWCSNSLTAGLADGTCAIFNNPGECNKMKPSKIIQAPSGCQGGVSNLAWAGNTLSWVIGNRVVHTRL